MAKRAELTIATLGLPQARQQRYGLEPRNHYVLREAERASALEVGNAMRGAAIAARLAVADAELKPDELRDMKVALATVQRLGAELVSRLTPGGVDVVEANSDSVRIELALEKL